MEFPRKPDFYVRVQDKNTKQRGTAGAAWKNEDGSISIVLDACATLSGRDTALSIRMFPVDYQSPYKAMENPKKQHATKIPPIGEPDDAPF